MSEQGCSDGNCKLRLTPVTGQHTNGGCQCLRDLPTQLRIQVERKLWSLKTEIKRLQEHEATVKRAFATSCWGCPSQAECGDLAFDAYNIGCDRLDCLGAK